MSKTRRRPRRLIGCNERCELGNGENLPKFRAEEQNEDKKELAEAQVTMEVWWSSGECCVQ